MPAKIKKAKKAIKTQNKDDHNVTIPLVRVLPPDLVTHFSDGTLISHTENEFVISFLQSQYPLVSNKEELQEVSQIVSKCIARIVVTPNHMEKIAEALKTNIEKYRASYQKTDGE